MGSSPWILLMIVALFSILLGREWVVAQDSSFVFDSFDCLRDQHVQCTGDSTSTGEGQLNLTGAWMGSVGRVLYLPGIRLLDPATSEVASFSTNFTFSTRGDYPKPGEGLAFVLLSNPTYVGSGGGFLGVYGPDGYAGTPTLAVEFDTYKNGKSGHFRFNDINDNHVGLDLESIQSKVQVDAGSFGIVFYKESKVTAWVEYYAPTGKHAGNLQVRISRDSSRPAAPLLSYKVDLSKIFTEYMYVGFSAATGDSCFSFHSILDWGFNSWGIPPPFSPLAAPPPGGTLPPPSPPAPPPSSLTPTESPPQSPAFPRPPLNPIVPILAPGSRPFSPPSPSPPPPPTGVPPITNAPPPLNPIVPILAPGSSPFSPPSLNPPPTGVPPTTNAPPPLSPIVPILAPASSLSPSPTTNGPAPGSGPPVQAPASPPSGSAVPPSVSPSSGNPSPFPPGPNQGPTSPAAAPPDLASGPSSNVPAPGPAFPPHSSVPQSPHNDHMPPTPSSTSAPGPGSNSTPGSGTGGGNSPSPGPLPGPSNSPSDDDDTTIRIVVPIVATLGALAALFGCCLAFACCRKRKREAEGAAPPEPAPVNAP